jgi:PAS domain S-box-containing protein
MSATQDKRSAARADELFDQHRHEIFRSTDQLFARLMLFQWLAGIVIALLVSPRTWEGQSAQIHVHVWSAIFVGGAISLFPVCMTRLWPGAVMTRHVIAVAQMLMSALLISLTGGRIETHFHVFGSLVILSFYRDWRVLVPATLVVALDHFLRGIYWPYSVYGVLSASPLRSLEHAGWVIFEDVFLVISCLRSIREMRAIANRTAALEASEQSSRQIFEDAPIGMATVDLDHRFTHANSRFCEMMGYSNEELQGRTPLDITAPEDVDKSVRLTQDLIEGRQRCRVEKRYVRKDGELLWGARTACLIRDENQEPRHFLIMVEDVSSRKKRDKDLHASREALVAALEANQRIMDNSLDVICTISETGQFLTASAACTQIWGYTPSELAGLRYIDLVHPDDRARTAEAQQTLVATGQITDFVNRYVRKDGGVVDVLWSATWSAKDKIMFCVAHDVTERSRNEKALRAAKEEADRANSAKSDFLSRMSHELRTPLNAILGFGQLLERQNPTETQRQRIGHVVKAGRHLLNLINEILDISRIDAGNFQVSLEPVCVADAVAEAVDLIRPLAAERSVEIAADAVPHDGCHVVADQQRLKQVLLNLLSNGVKYTPVGAKISVSSVLREGGSMRISVHDTGAGIPPSKLPLLFMPFERLGAELSNVEGTGLGLALSKRLVDAMNGSIGVDSEVGSGSTFWIDLPLADSPLAQMDARSRAASPSVDELPGTRRKLLYIEDNLSNLMLMEQVLGEFPDVELLSAIQGRVGVDLARQHAPDVILLDLHLPDIPGWKVLDLLRTDESTRHIPVIVISADATSRQVKRLLDAGAQRYITKPIDIVEFARAIEETTATARETRERAAA